MDYNNHFSSVGVNLIAYLGKTYTLEEFKNHTDQEEHGISRNPQFVDAANHNFHLKSTSPCIDSGTDVGLTYYGPKPDIGAFEYEMNLYKTTPPAKPKGVKIIE